MYKMICLFFNITNLTLFKSKSISCKIYFYIFFVTNTFSLIFRHAVQITPNVKYLRRFNIVKLAEKPVVYYIGFCIY